MASVCVKHTGTHSVGTQFYDTCKLSALWSKDSHVDYREEFFNFGLDCLNRIVLQHYRVSSYKIHRRRSRDQGSEEGLHTINNQSNTQTPDLKGTEPCVFGCSAITMFKANGLNDIRTLIAAQPESGAEYLRSLLSAAATLTDMQRKESVVNYKIHEQLQREQEVIIKAILLIGNPLKSMRSEYARNIFNYEAGNESEISVISRWFGVAAKCDMLVMFYEDLAK
ncbi:hypothetical protein CAPTEDRAFT_189148 [Capitella teleta]|uniref:Uncharacterized protein n=1 Tax=Capitella teleta TaxID=283909 RepID=R7T3P4_CAPTE|nr:hypothetical protein CAPTEDRAFT_189148 [Capitella teleta]|eukprot:ELT87348.1 hypothetical protein CAPTEDRAFT_189148 [Capitella teleta]